MGYFGLDGSALEFFRTLLFWLTCIFGGAALLGVGIYGALLYVEIFSSQARSRGSCMAQVANSINCPPLPEENLARTTGTVAADKETIFGQPVFPEEG